MPEPRCTCSVYANEPSRSCPKHGGRYDPITGVRFMRWKDWNPRVIGQFIVGEGISLHLTKNPSRAT